MLRFAFAILGILGFMMMHAKYMENQFRMTASDASLYSGPVSAVTNVSAILLSAYVIQRFKPSARVLCGAMAAVDLLLVSQFLFLMIPQCQAAGSKTFVNPMTTTYESTCSGGCGCTTRVFMPICDVTEQRTYFSPCFAGCTVSEEESFSNCSCLLNSSVDPGFCDVEDCFPAALTYMIINIVFGAMISTMQIPFGLLTLRCISKEDKSFALGIQEAAMSLLAFIPYPIVFGSLVDSACLIWEENCNISGNCWLYDTGKLNHMLHGASATFVGISALLSGIAYCHIGRIKNLYGEDTSLE